MKELIDSYGLENVLKSLGLEKITEGEDKYKFSSPFREDNNPSMVCYKNGYYCIDFGGDFRGSIFKLIKEITGQSSLKFFGVTDNISSWMFQHSLHYDANRVRNAFKKKQTDILKATEVQIDGKLESVYNSDLCREELNRRGIDEDFVNTFDLRFVKSAYVNSSYYPWRDRLVCPIVEGGRWISIEGRDITRKQPRKVLYPKGGTSNTLYNIDNLDYSKPLFIVEGIMDTVGIWKHETKNVTATFGVNLTSRQKNLLSKFETVYLFIDDDKAGDMMVNSFDSFFDREFYVCKVKGKDPGDSSKEEINSAIANAVSSTEYFIQKHGLFQKEELIW